jgi:uncharacterized cupredoxin-like copper-binding protein
MGSTLICSARLMRMVVVRVALATLSLLLSAGCVGQSRPITVTAQGFRFAPDTIELPAGQPVKLTLRNPDSIEHDFQVDHLPMKLTASEMKHVHDEMANMPGMNSAGSMDMLHVHGLPGQSHAITFTPTKPGTYTVYCTVAGHREAGMTASLVVR